MPTGRTPVETAAPAAPGDASAEMPDPLRFWVLAACCTVALSRLVDPKLWMIGWDIPPTAFGAGWQSYRIYSVVSIIIMLACMLFGGPLGDFFGRRRVLLLGTVVSTLAGMATRSLPECAVVRRHAYPRRCRERGGVPADPGRDPPDLSWA